MRVFLEWRGKKCGACEALLLGESVEGWGSAERDGAWGPDRALWEEAPQPPPRGVLLPQLSTEHLWEFLMHVVLGIPLGIQVYGGPVLQVYVTVCEQRDHSPECARTPHLMETVCNRWRARPLHSSLSDFFRYPEIRNGIE